MTHARRLAPAAIVGWGSLGATAGSSEPSPCGPEPAAIVGWGSLGACAVAALIATASCDEPTLPGNALGTYDVTGTLASNSCGTDLAAMDSLGPFSAMMSQSTDGSTLYWSSDYGNTTVAPDVLSGALVDSSATMTSSVQTNVDGTNGVGGPCCIETDHTVAVALGGGSPPATFTGTLTWSYSAVAACSNGCTSSDPTTCCADQLISSGGEYEAIPCSFSYSVTGSLQ